MTTGPFFANFQAVAVKRHKKGPARHGKRQTFGTNRESTRAENPAPEKRARKRARPFARFRNDGTEREKGEFRQNILALTMTRSSVGPARKHAVPYSVR